MKHTLLLLGLLLLLTTAGCDNDDGGDDGGTPDVNNDKTEPVGQQGVNELNESSIVGDWTYTDEWGDTEGFVFNADGTLGAPEEFEFDDGATWALEGNVLTVEYSYSGSEEGMTYSENRTWATTAAIVNGRFYTDAMLRMEGSGDSLDGEWMLVDNDNQSGIWGDESVNEMDNVRKDLTITKGTYSLVDTFEWSATESGWGTESDSGQTTCKGAVTIEGDTVILTPDSDFADECEVDKLTRVGEDVMVWLWDWKWDM